MLLAAGLLLAGLSQAAELRFLRPIRTNEPGTGVFIGSGALGQVLVNRESNGTEKLREVVSLFDLRYTPATHWVFGVRIPYVLERRLERPLGTESSDGLGDVLLSAKHRFFRTVGQWSDRHGAVEVGLKLPTGASDRELDSELPVELRRRLQPGSGSTDLFFDLIYQEGRRRFVYGGDLSYWLRTEAENYAFGDEIRLNLDFEYILLPWTYTRPGNELFILLETSFIHRSADELEGEVLRDTRRTELLLAPGAQYIATEQMLFSISVQFPVHTSVSEGGFRRDLNVLAEIRYAF